MNLPFNVNKHTRAGRDGREIVCPKCDEKNTVYHFSWTGIECRHCGKDVAKQDWGVALTDKEKYTGKTSIWGNGFIMKEKTYLNCLIQHMEINLELLSMAILWVWGHFSMKYMAQY